MTYTISVNNSTVLLGENNLFFHGYINHKGRLLYDEVAANEIQTLLQTHSLQELFKTINGAFQLIYLKENILYFSIDHFGGYTLFYKIKDTSIELFDNPMTYPHHSKLNDLALCSLMASGFTLGQDTIFEGVTDCSSGTLYKFNLQTGKLDITKWLNYYSQNEKALETGKLLSIIKNLFPDIDTGQYTLSLSGGIDSRFLLGILLNKGQQFQTYSFGSEYNQDRQFAAKLAAHFGINHITHEFNPDVCSRYFSDKDLDYILNYCVFGRSLPNETDLISSRELDPKQHIIVKGFGGDWLTGRYITPDSIRVETEEQMTRYLFAKYFQLTCISSPSFMKTLFKRLENLLHTKYYPFNPGLVSAEEQWNLHHNEKKYIVNTLAFYKEQGYRFYLPFYDRNLMRYFAKLKFSEKIDQIGYFIFLRKYFFIGKLSPLRELPTLRGNFMSPITLNKMQRIKSMARSLIRNLDKKKMRKRFSQPSLTEYADTLMLFNHNSKPCPYLRQTIGQNFPQAVQIAEYLEQHNYPRAAAHITWLTKQATSQINVNGLSLCKFFFSPQFLHFLQEHHT